MRIFLLVPLICAWLAACADPPYRIAAQDGEGWVLSVSATAERVLAVGGQPGTEGRPGQGKVTILRGAERTERETLPGPGPGMLWWVHQAPGAAAAWMAGEAGVVLRYQEGEGLRAVPTPTRATLYGIWAFSDQDVWAVGGEQGAGVVLRGGVDGFTVDATAPRVGTLYKVYGADPGHLFAVGAGGALLRRSGDRWQQDPPLLPAQESLLSAYGRGPEEVYAVGGLGQGRVLRWDGRAWTLLPTPGLADLAGVFVDEAGVVVVGRRGLIAELRDGAFSPRPERATEEDLHAVFGLGRERLAVGGNLSQFMAAPPRGVILRQVF
jgi:hypothetical protein